MRLGERAREEQRRFGILCQRVPEQALRSLDSGCRRKSGISHRETSQDSYSCATGFPLHHQGVRSTRVGRAPKQAERAPVRSGIEDEMVSVGPQPGRIEFQGASSVTRRRFPPRSRSITPMSMLRVRGPPGDCHLAIVRAQTESVVTVWLAGRADAACRFGPSRPAAARSPWFLIHEETRFGH